VNTCRELLATELVALVGESYSRAYPDIVRAQQCTELSEVLQYLRLRSSVSGLPSSDADTDATPEGALYCSGRNLDARRFAA
jgi:FAT domain